MKEITITKDFENQRLDKYLKRLITGESSGFIYKMLRKKNITLNGKKADGTEIIKAGDAIKFFFSDETFDKVTGGFIVENSDKNISKDDNENKASVIKKACAGAKPDIDIILENDDVLIINKPVGILSQKASETDISINEMALAYLYQNKKITDDSYRMFHPSVVNRLDRNTSGLILYGKTLKGSQFLSKILSDRTITKLYRSVVKGEFKTAGSYKAFLFKDEASNRVVISDVCKDGYKPIETAITPIKYYEKNDITLVEIHLVTGKSHQIRAHLSYLGHPLIGDYKYGDKITNDKYKSKYGIKCQLLHSYRIILSDNEDYLAPVPTIFEKVFE